MKKAILLISFGTSHRAAAEKSIDAIAGDLSKAYNDMTVYQAYTSSMVIRKLAKEGVRVYNIDEAVERAYEDKTDILCVISSHIIPGHEYNKMLAALEKHRYKFTSVSIAEPLLYTQSDCDHIASVLNDVIGFKAENEYILMGHGTDADANVMYFNMNDALMRKGYNNVHIATVDASPTLEETIKSMRSPGSVESVILHPFLTVAGEHALNDMAGEDNSFLTRLNALGYNTWAVLKGLGEYDRFRNIYVCKLKTLLEK